MGVNSLAKTVTRQRRGCDLNPGPSAPESSPLTTRPPRGKNDYRAIRARSRDETAEVENSRRETEANGNERIKVTESEYGWSAHRAPCSAQ